MEQKKIDELNTAALEGSLLDDENPIFLFSLTNTKLLVQIVKGEIDAVELARLQLKNRGLNEEGSWIGFSKNND